MDFIKFLGTAGARVVVAKQLRASGGKERGGTVLAPADASSDS